ncbi:MAG: 30S ribosome-binding factor RbfA [Bdellovibrionales bacterium]|nr:30S ribosome-binding factor RbfA [Bdellovibrionales bacterium]
MDATRRARVEALILEELTVLIRRGIKDPRVDGASVTRVELTEDARQATVYVSALGFDALPADDDTLARCVEGLSSAAGFLRRKLGPSLQIRHIPELLFRADRGLSNTLRVEELLRQLEAEKAGRKSDPEGA